MTLSLSLLEAGILFVDHIQLAFSAHDLAINTAFFNGCSNFHTFFISSCYKYYLYLKMILPLVKS